MERENPGLNVNIDPKDLEDVVCDKCGSQCFEQTFLFKRLSAVLSPTGQETMIPLQIYRCADCGNINDIFLPKQAEIQGE
tara:strand:+ start:316 stop:555 length:240 start_codon:yes stop_codon:yes gene_type:complete